MDLRLRTIVLSLTLLITMTSAQRKLLCNFDNAQKDSEVFMCDCNGDCPLVQEQLNDQFNWKAWNDETPSSDTGPPGDHTTGTGFYVYAEASDVNPNDRATLHTPGFSLSQTGCLVFWYSMKGQHIGNLQVEVSFINGSSATIWERVGEQGDGWIEGKVALDQSVNKVSFITVRGGISIGMPYGDIALDDIEINDQICSGFTDSSTDPVTPTTQAPTTPLTSTTITTTNSPTTKPTPQPSTSRLPTTSTPTSSTTTISSTIPTTRSKTTTTPATPTPTTATLTPTPTTHTPSTNIVSSTPTQPPTTNTGTASSTSTTTTSSASLTGEQGKLWGLDETLWIIILVVLGAVILVLLIIVCVQACAMRRMRTARIVRQSDDYSNIEAYTQDPNFPQRSNGESKRDNYINAYDNMGIDHENNKPPHNNGGGGML